MVAVSEVVVGSVSASGEGLAEGSGSNDGEGK